MGWGYSASWGLLSTLILWTGHNHLPTVLQFHVYFNLLPFLSNHYFEFLWPLAILRVAEKSHVKIKFLQSSCSRRCHIQMRRLCMTDGSRPFRGPQHPLFICKNWLSCQFPATTNASQCQFLHWNNFFFCLQRGFQRSQSDPPCARGRYTSTVPSDTVTPPTTAPPRLWAWPCPGLSGAETQAAGKGLQLHILEKARVT